MDAYPWPGNVRELENVIERALVLSRLEPGDALGPAHLPDEVRRAAPAAPGTPAPDDAGAPPLDLAAAVRRLRGFYLAEALRLSGGNKVQAARLLGISRRALYDLLSEGAQP
jgi:two-component system response regulator AtoC